MVACEKREAIFPTINLNLFILQGMGLGITCLYPVDEATAGFSGLLWF